MTLANLDAHTASLNNLRTALRGADAYSGASRMGVAQMAEYARKVQILRADGETVAITAATVDGLMAAEVVAPEAQPEPAAEVVAAEPAADVAALLAQVAQVVAKKTARPVPSLGKKFTALFTQLLTVAQVQEDGTIVATANDIKVAGWSTSYTTTRTGWGKTKSGGMAAAAQGYTTTTQKADDGFVVVIAQAA